MPPRAIWTGQVRLSLVSFGVRMYAATESAKKVAMNQLHRDCNQRIKQQMVCPTHGPINREDIVKGYQYEKDRYVIMDAEELEAIRLQSTKTIDLTQFVDADEIDPLYVNAPYFIGPDGPVAEEAFRTIREAMSREGKIAIGKVVMNGREQAVALSVHGKGFLLATLRFATEVRSGDQYFEDVKDDAPDEEQVQLATTIMQSKAASFDPKAFTDGYQEAFFEIVKAKLEGSELIQVEAEQAPSAFNFMDALKQSVDDATKAGKVAAGGKKAPAKKKPAAKSVTRKKKSSQKPDQKRA